MSGQYVTSDTGYRSDGNYPSEYVTPDDHGAEISAKLDKIIELLETQVGALITAQEEADQPEEVDRGYLDG